MINNKRWKYLVQYPLNEEMEVSPEFNSGNYFYNQPQRALALEVGIDENNDELHRLNLILQFGKTSGYEELSFYFNITNKENTKVTSQQKSIYDRNAANQYIPKELIGKKIFKEKINDMCKDLLTVEKPESFFMVTFEDYKDEKQISYYLDLVRIIQNNGYVMKNQGTSPENRYFWEFANKSILENYYSKEENKKWINFTPPPRDAEYWKNQDEIVDALLITMREKYVKKTKRRARKK